MTISKFWVSAIVQLRDGAIVQLTASVALAFFSGLVDRRPGNDSKLSCSFPLFHGSVTQLQGWCLSWLRAVATVAAVRRMDLVLEAAQHDQVEKAAIPALLSQVTAANTNKGAVRIFQAALSTMQWWAHSVPHTGPMRLSRWRLNTHFILLSYIIVDVKKDSKTKQKNQVN